MVQGISGHDESAATAATAALSAGGTRGAEVADGPRFAEVLAARGEREEDVRSQVREQARMFVATALIHPLLAQMRDDPFRSDLFHGGFAEDAFASQLDTILSDRIVDQMDTRAAAQPNEAGGSALVELVYRHIVRHPAVAERVRLEERARAYEGIASHE